MLWAGASYAANPSQFWDNNGLSTPSDGVWDSTTPNWSSTSNLTATPSVFVSGSFAEFVAGTNPLATLNITLPDNSVVCSGLTTGFAGFTGAPVTNATFLGAGSLGISNGFQGILCPTNGTITFLVPLTGPGGIDPQGGEVILDGTNTFTGGSEVSAGATLFIGGSGSLGAGTFSSPLTNLGALVFDTSAAQTLAGPVSGSGTLTNLGTGPLTLSATNTYTGATTIGSGSTLIIGPTGQLGGLNYNAMIFNSGSLVYSGDLPPTAQNLNGVISGPGTVTALNCALTSGTTAPAGQLSLLGLGGNTYTGITSITNAYVLITNDSGLGTPPASLVANQLTLNVALNGDILGLRLQSHSTTLAPTRGIYLGNTGTGVTGGAFNVQSGNTLTIAGPITGPGSFSAGCNASFGNGTVVVSNAGNTYAGATYIEDGTLTLGVSGALPTGTPLLIAYTAGASATFNLNGNSQTVGPLQNIAAQGGSGTAISKINLTGPLTVLQTNISTTFGGVISGVGGSLTINTAAGGTAGTLTLTNTNNYSGPTVISGATLALSGAAGIASTASLTIGAGGTFDVSAETATTYSFGTTTLTASGNGTAPGTSAATIVGASGGTVNLGSGMITLNFTPTSFSGDSSHPSLYVSQGTLMFNGNSITVNNANATPLGVGTYTLIQAPAISGAPASAVTVTGSGIASGAAASVSVSGGNVVLTVSSGGSFPRPTITKVQVSGTTLTLMATNGTPNGQFVLLGTTNLTSPFMPILTNSFDSSGNINLSTNIVSPSNPVEFFTIQNP